MPLLPVDPGVLQAVLRPGPSSRPHPRRSDQAVATPCVTSGDSGDGPWAPLSDLCLHWPLGGRAHPQGHFCPWYQPSAAAQVCLGLHSDPSCPTGSGLSKTRNLPSPQHREPWAHSTVSPLPDRRPWSDSSPLLRTRLPPYPQPQPLAQVPAAQLPLCPGAGLSPSAPAGPPSPLFLLNSYLSATT